MTYAKGEKEPEFDFKGAGVKTPLDLWAKCGHGLICLFFLIPLPPLLFIVKKELKKENESFSLSFSCQMAVTTCSLWSMWLRG